ncbi:MAG: SRPBCC family protein [Acidimicrobiales bacterium]
MEYEAERSTDASAAAVWEAFTDIEAWPELTPSVRTARRLDAGPLRVGSRARVKQPGLLPTTWRVIDLDLGRSFTWQTRALGITTTAGHKVFESRAGTRLVLTLRQTGPLAGVFSALYRRRTRRYVDLEAQGLVAAAEKRATGL